LHIKQVDLLRAKKQQLVTLLNVTSKNYAAAEAQNSVLRTQMTELQSRLCALREMIYNMTAANQLANNAATLAINPSTFVGAAANYNAFGTSAWTSGMQMVQQPIEQLLYQCF
jgi:phage shock protein A